MSTAITDIAAFKQQRQDEQAQALNSLRSHASAILSLTEGRASLDDAAYQYFLANDSQLAALPDLHQDALDKLEYLAEQLDDALDFFIGSYVEYCLDNDRDVVTLGFDDGNP